MIVELPAAAILIGAGLLAPLVPARLRPAFLAAAPLVALWQLAGLAPGESLRAELFGFALEPVRVDRLSLAFGYVFAIASFLNAIYAWHVRTALEPAAAMVYAGAAGDDYCGTIQGVREAADLASIQNIGVTPEHRGWGLGTLLIQQALAGLRQAGLRRVYLEVTAQNDGAVRLYHRLGFVKARVLYKTQDLVVA